MKYGVGSANFMAVSERDTTVTSCLGDHEAGQIGCTTPCRFPNRPVQAVETETPPRSASSHAADTASPSWMGKPASPARCKAVATTFETASSESDELRSIGSATFVPVAAVVHGTREAHQEARAYAASPRKRQASDLPDHSQIAARAGVDRPTTGIDERFPEFRTASTSRLLGKSSFVGGQHTSPEATSFREATILVYPQFGAIPCSRTFCGKSAILMEHAWFRSRDSQAPAKDRRHRGVG